MDVKRNKLIKDYKINKNILKISKKDKTFKNIPQFHKFLSNKKLKCKKKIEEEKTGFISNINSHNKTSNLIHFSENFEFNSSPNKILIIEGNNNSKNITDKSILDTEKIDFRYHKIYNTNDLMQKNNINNNNIKNRKYYWLATYDKLMRKSKILKILNFYSKEKTENTNNNIIEKCIKIDDFEIFYNINSDIPYIRPMKNNYILVKLYLLTYDQINLVLSYINRVDKKIFIGENLYRNDLIEKGKYEKLFNNAKDYPYALMYYLGNYMNYNIVSFSNFFYNDKTWTYNNFGNSQKYPSAKNIANLVKLLMINFPDKKIYSIDFFIFYLLENVKHINFNKKYDEIKKILLNSNIQNNHKRNLISCLDDIHSNFNKLNNFNETNNYNTNINKRKMDKEEVIVDRFNSLENFKNKLIDSFEKKDAYLNYSLISNTDSTTSKMINPQIGMTYSDNSKNDNEYDISTETLTFNFINIKNIINQKNKLGINNYKHKTNTKEFSKKIPLNKGQHSDILSYDCLNSKNFCILHGNKFKTKLTKKPNSINNNKIAIKKNINSLLFFNKKNKTTSTYFKNNKNRKGKDND